MDLGLCNYKVGNMKKMLIIGGSGGIGKEMTNYSQTIMMSYLVVPRRLTLLT